MATDSTNRRRHRLFVTRHTEYHLRDDECVGVRDRDSGRWVRDHAALRLRALGLTLMMIVITGARSRLGRSAHPVLGLRRGRADLDGGRGRPTPA